MSDSGDGSKPRFSIPDPLGDGVEGFPICRNCKGFKHDHIGSELKCPFASTTFKIERIAWLRPSFVWPDG